MAGSRCRICCSYPGAERMKPGSLLNGFMMTSSWLHVGSAVGYNNRPGHPARPGYGASVAWCTQRIEVVPKARCSLSRLQPSDVVSALDIARR
jgi:hypothetical protein